MLVILLRILSHRWSTKILNIKKWNIIVFTIKTFIINHKYNFRKCDIFWCRYIAYDNFLVKYYLVIRIYLLVFIYLRIHARYKNLNVMSLTRVFFTSFLQFVEQKHFSFVFRRMPSKAALQSNADCLAELLQLWDKFIRIASCKCNSVQKF